MNHTNGNTRLPSSSLQTNHNRDNKTRETPKRSVQSTRSHSLTANGHNNGHRTHSSIDNSADRKNTTPSSEKSLRSSSHEAYHCRCSRRSTPYWGYRHTDKDESSPSIAKKRLSYFPTSCRQYPTRRGNAHAFSFYCDPFVFLDSPTHYHPGDYIN